MEAKSIVENREFKRMEFREPVEYNFPNLDRWGGCLGCDLSEQGLRVNLNDFVPLKEVVNFRMKFKGNPRPVDVHGKVVWIQRVPFSDRYQAGVQFFEINSSSQSTERIQQYIQAQQLFKKN